MIDLYTVSVASHHSDFTYDDVLYSLEDATAAIAPYQDYSKYCSSICENGDVETITWTNVPTPP